MSINDSSVVSMVGGRGRVSGAGIIGVQGCSRVSCEIQSCEVQSCEVQSWEDSEVAADIEVLSFYVINEVLGEK